MKAIWITPLLKAQTLLELEQQASEEIIYFTEKFISAKKSPYRSGVPLWQGQLIFNIWQIAINKLTAS